MFYDSKTQIIQFTDQQKGTENPGTIEAKSKKQWKAEIELSKNTL